MTHFVEAGLYVLFARSRKALHCWGVSGRLSRSSEQLKVDV